MGSGGDLVLDGDDHGANGCCNNRERSDIGGFFDSDKSSEFATA